MASLSLKHIYKVYAGGVRAVNDCNLEINDKSFVVLVGPSGCGKSTTLRMIAGLESITSGQLYIDGTCVNDIDSKERDIAMVFQSYALYPHMTVYENMGFGLKLKGYKPEEIKEKVLNAAKVLEIEDLLDRKPKALSGGQRQRVALGRAIVRNPNVFLLDEPLSNLDAKLRVQMRTEITKLHERLQTTFIYVTHDQTEAMTMGDMIVVMKKGIVQQADAPITLFEDPTNLFVATFLGSPQMNIIESKLVKTKTGYDVLLEGVKENNIILKKNDVKLIKANKIDIKKPILFGVRPDYIKVSNKGIPATIEVIEQLGDQTILHCKIEKHNKYVVVKLPLTGGLNVKDKIKLEINTEHVYLFDKESEHSLIGVPAMNVLPCKFKNNNLIIGKQESQLSDSSMNHLIDEYKNTKTFVGFKPEHVLLEKFVDSIHLKVKIDFVEKRTKYIALYTKIEGLDEYLILRAPLNSNYKEKQNIDIYVPKQYINIYDKDGTRLSSRELIYKNKCEVNVTKKDINTIISINHGQKLIYPNVDLKEGKYEMTLSQDLNDIVFNKKVAKSLNVEKGKAIKHQSLTVSCYDEDPIGSKNIIYCQIKGFNEYVTLVSKKDFSVYKMPKFDINVPFESLSLKPLNK